MAQDPEARKRVPSVICISTCCLVCSGLYACYTDTFNGSYRFPFRHEQCVLVRARSAVVSLLCKSLVVDLDTARFEEVLCFVYNSGDQDRILPVQRVSNLDTDLKGT